MFRSSKFPTNASRNLITTREKGATFPGAHLVVQGAVQADELDAGVQLRLPSVGLHLGRRRQQVLLADALLPEAAARQGGRRGVRTCI